MAGVPWLTTPAEQMGAMESGARIGLARRAQNQSDLEAAQKLDLAYNQLSAQNFRAAQEEQARQQHAAQALLQNQQRLDETKKYHEDLIKQRDASHELKKSVHVVPGVGLVEYDPDTGAAKVLQGTTYKDSTGAKTQDDKVTQKDLDSQLRELDKAIAKEPDENKKKDLRQQRASVYGQMRQIGKPVSFEPVMGKKQEMDAASMLNQDMPMFSPVMGSKQASDNLTDTNAPSLNATPSGYKWKEVK